MRYQFDSKEEIYDCTYCPFYDPLFAKANIFQRHPWQCWINKKELLDVLGTKPDWCPLVEIKEAAKNE